MKKIFICLCFLVIFGCTGYKPIFSTKNFVFNITEIQNIDNNKTTKQIIKSIRSYKLDNDVKKNYSLKINSQTTNDITSRDSRGNPLTYRIIVSVEVKVFKDNSNKLFNNINIIKDFTYNYQTNQFELGQYEKNITDNLIVKIAEEIILELQLI